MKRLLIIWVLGLMLLGTASTASAQEGRTLFDFSTNLAGNFTGTYNASNHSYSKVYTSADAFNGGGAEMQNSYGHWPTSTSGAVDLTGLSAMELDVDLQGPDATVPLLIWLQLGHGDGAGDFEFSSQMPIHTGFNRVDFSLTGYSALQLGHVHQIGITVGNSPALTGSDTITLLGIRTTGASLLTRTLADFTSSSLDGRLQGLVVGGQGPAGVVGNTGAKSQTGITTSSVGNGAAHFVLQPVSGGTDFQMGLGEFQGHGDAPFEDRPIDLSNYTTITVRLQASGLSADLGMHSWFQGSGFSLFQFSSPFTVNIDHTNAGLQTVSFSMASPGVTDANKSDLDVIGLRFDSVPSGTATFDIDSITLTGPAFSPPPAPTPSPTPTGTPGPTPTPTPSPTPSPTPTLTANEIIYDFNSPVPTEGWTVQNFGANATGLDAPAGSLIFSTLGDGVVGHNFAVADAYDNGGPTGALTAGPNNPNNDFANQKAIQFTIGYTGSSTSQTCQLWIQANGRGSGTPVSFFGGPAFQVLGNVGLQTYSINFTSFTCLSSGDPSSTPVGTQMREEDKASSRQIGLQIFTYAAATGTLNWSIGSVSVGPLLNNTRRMFTFANNEQGASVDFNSGGIVGGSGQTSAGLTRVAGGQDSVIRFNLMGGAGVSPAIALVGTGFGVNPLSSAEFWWKPADLRPYSKMVVTANINGGTTTTSVTMRVSYRNAAFQDVAATTRSVPRDSIYHSYSIPLPVTTDAIQDQWIDLGFNDTATGDNPQVNIDEVDLVFVPPPPVLNRAKHWEMFQ